MPEQVFQRLYNKLVMASMSLLKFQSHQGLWLGLCFFQHLLKLKTEFLILSPLLKRQLIVIEEKFWHI